MQEIALKEKVYLQLIQLLNEKIATAEAAIASAKESRDNETKSSVGDKYETGRAMMQIEQQKNEVQLSKAILLKQTLAQINIKKEIETGELGALVNTNLGMFFLTVGLGKIAVDQQRVFAISMAAPLGKLLYGKKAGDQFSFNQKDFKIISIN